MIESEYSAEAASTQHGPDQRRENIRINASASVFHGYTVATTEAYADPYVFIDPTFGHTPPILPGLS